MEEILQDGTVLPEMSTPELLTSVESVLYKQFFCGWSNSTVSQLYNYIG